MSSPDGPVQHTGGTGDTAAAPAAAFDGTLRFTDAEFARRHTLVRAMMDHAGLDALVVYGNTAAYSEVHYLSDFRVTREAMLLFPLRGDPALFVQYYNHLPYARREARVPDVRWGGRDTAATLAGVVTERGLAAGRLGIAGAIPWQHEEALRRALPSAILTDASPALRQLRLVKSDEELAHLRQGAALSDRAIAALEREARPGLSEYELVAIIENAYLGLGGQTHIHYLATTPMRQPSCCVPSQQPSSRVLEPGDVLITEMSAQYHGYAGQILRPFAIAAPPTHDYQRLYDLAIATFERVSAVIRPGAIAADVLEAAEGVHAAGFTICDDLVHGFGGGYLPPIIRTRQSGGTGDPAFTFAESMTLVIQPNIITPDERMGLQVGELVRVTATGVESLHSYPMRFIRCG